MNTLLPLPTSNQISELLQIPELPSTLLLSETQKKKSTIFQIYSQNVTGAKSKVKSISHQLSAVCLQETWLMRNSIQLR